MKQYYISSLKVNDEIQDFFMVKSIAVKIGSNKKQYLDILLGDSSGEIGGKKWDIADPELPVLDGIKEGDLVKVKAQVNEWNGMRQLRVLKVRKTVESDEVELSDYIKAAPEKPENMLAYIEGCAAAMQDSDLKKICLYLLDTNREKLLYYPAAMKNHHAEMGGLLYHIKRMLLLGERICDVYGSLNKDLVMTGVIIHDMEKINEILSDEMGISNGYSFEGQLLGHIVQGVKSIDRICIEMGIDDEKRILLEHMILSHHYEPEFGSPKKPLFPEAEVLHYLDIIDARMYDMEEALKGIEPGSFSDKVWTLENRKLYKPVAFEEIGADYRE